MFKRFVLCAAVIASLSGAARAEKIVCISAHVVEAGPEAFAALVAPRLGGKSDAPLTPAEAERLIAGLSAHPDAAIMAAPKVVTHPGRECRFHAGDRQHFITGVAVSADNGQVSCAPRNEAVDLGVAVTFMPELCDKGVRLKTDFRHARLRSSHVPLFSVATVTFPTDGGKSAPFTQFIQMPTIDRVSLGRTFEIAQNGYVLADAGEVTVEDRSGKFRAFVAERPALERVARRVAPEAFARTKKARCVLLLSAGATEATPVVGK